MSKKILRKQSRKKSRTKSRKHSRSFRGMRVRNGKSKPDPKPDPNPDPKYLIYKQKYRPFNPRPQKCEYHPGWGGRCEGGDATSGAPGQSEKTRNYEPKHVGLDEEFFIDDLQGWKLSDFLHNSPFEDKTLRMQFWEWREQDKVKTTIKDLLKTPKIPDKQITIESDGTTIEIGSYGDCNPYCRYNLVIEIPEEIVRNIRTPVFEKAAFEAEEAQEALQAATQGDDLAALIEAIAAAERLKAPPGSFGAALKAALEKAWKRRDVLHVEAALQAATQGDDLAALEKAIKAAEWMIAPPASLLEAARARHDELKADEVAAAAAWGDDLTAEWLKAGAWRPGDDDLAA